MDANDLADADVRFFAAFDGDEAVAMGALKRVSSNLGELKSMHVRKDCRGQGLADAILARLLQAADDAGMTRVSLETGSQPTFAPARAFYQRHGFSVCPPFDGYVEDPHSVFMTRAV